MKITEQFPEEEAPKYLGKLLYFNKFPDENPFLVTSLGVVSLSDQDVVLFPNCLMSEIEEGIDFEEHGTAVILPKGYKVTLEQE